MILFRHNNEVYHIRIYTQEINGSVKHYLVDSLLFDSLQVRYKKYVKVQLTMPCFVSIEDFNSILSNTFIGRSFSACEKFVSTSDRTCM